PSPTTTRAAKENRRPPLTTLATRLMLTTRSARSRSFGVIGVATGKLPVRILERQPGLARGLGHRGHPAVVGEAVAVEDHRLDIVRLALLGDQLANARGVGLLVAFRLTRELLGQRGGVGQGPPGRVVHDLSVDVLETLVDGEARPLGGARELPTDARLALDAGNDVGHEVSRSFRR